MPQNIPDWQKEIMAQAKKMTNKQLFEATIDAQQPDDWDGEYTARGTWKSRYLLDCLKSRLGAWFKEDLTSGPR